jgi:hypothetical protein
VHTSATKITFLSYFGNYAKHEINGIVGIFLAAGVPCEALDEKALPTAPLSTGLSRTIAIFI